MEGILDFNNSCLAQVMTPNLDFCDFKSYVYHKQHAIRGPTAIADQVLKYVDLAFSSAKTKKSNSNKRVTANETQVEEVSARQTPVIPLENKFETLNNDDNVVMEDKNNPPPTQDNKPKIKYTQPLWMV